MVRLRGPVGPARNTPNNSLFRSARAQQPGGGGDPDCGDPIEYLHNEIWSPSLDFIHDIGGTPIPQGASTILALDVYRDGTGFENVFSRVRVRSSVQGCAGAWRTLNTSMWGPLNKSWSRFTAEIGDLIDPGAETIQVSIRVFDLLSFYCVGVFTPADCHTHSPLVDNVEVIRVDTTTVTGLPDRPVIPRTFALYQNWANPFNPTTTITYDVPNGGGQVDISIYDVAGKRIRRLVYGVESSGRKTVA